MKNTIVIAVDNFACYTTNDGTGNIYEARIVGVKGDKVSICGAKRVVKEINKSQIVRTYFQEGLIIRG